MNDEKQKSTERAAEKADEKWIAYTNMDGQTELIVQKLRLDIKQNPPSSSTRTQQQPCSSPDPSRLLLQVRIDVPLLLLPSSTSPPPN
ncbi:hypothetical protein WR25_01702 [Diploscapter pachys]|uniref:Uncharacterized protein n=1 Tax=Diploscapter pachys TaxID=2018661 RepID=A0A2A2JSS4_9BILA|nr:hypothetical protein WR25_01702 [Diploscapter pachys]